MRKIGVIAVVLGIALLCQPVFVSDNSLENYNAPCIEVASAALIAPPTVASAWAYTSPTIDGFLSDNEWGDASKVVFTISTPELHDCCLYVKNDAQNLYLLMVIEDEEYNLNDYFTMKFDNDNDGIFEFRDDSLIIGGLRLGVGAGHDNFFVTIEDYGFCGWIQDTMDEGTDDIVGAARHTNPTEDGMGTYIFEFSHPLNTEDDTHDFSLFPGDIVGFRIVYRDAALPDRYLRVNWPSESLGHLILAKEPEDNLLPVAIITSPLEITPEKDKYYVCDTLTAKFAIKNIGNEPITFDKLLLGGRFNGGKLPNGEYPDFTPQALTLDPGHSHQYEETLKLTEAGDYHFFCTYQTPDGEWNTCIDLGPGLTDEDRVKDIKVLLPEGPHICSIDPSSGAPGIKATIRGMNFNYPFPYQYVSFGRQTIVTSEAIDWKDDEIILEVPPPLYGVLPEDKTVEVTVGPIPMSNSALFTYKEPFIDYIEPKFGEQNTEVKIKGKDFGFESVLGINTYVYFGKSSAGETTSNWKDDEIIVKAPRDYGTGANDKLFKLAIEVLVCIGSEGMVCPDPIEYLIDSIFDLSDNRVRIRQNGNIEVDVTVYTAVEQSNVKVFTYGVPPLEYIHLASPAELMVYDSEGRITGLVSGEVKEEIPNSAYFESTVGVLAPSDSYRYQVAGTEEGTYGLTIASVENGETSTFIATDIPTTSEAIHEYTIDWEALSQGEKGVTVQIDSDGDGAFEQTITTDDTFQLPIASFTYTPENPVVDEIITFNASGSYDPDGIITKYEWNFGNGDIIDTTEPIITHSYALAGDYTVNLMVTNDDGATDIDSTTLTIEKEAEDTIPPTIESVTLDAYMAIPDATIHVTVEATDNVGVTSVTADGIALVETGSTWEGDITAPSATGDYTLTIIAEDAAGNVAETAVDYSVVTPTGGLGVAILPKISSAPAGSTLPLDIKIVSTENFDDILHVYVTVDGIPADYQADLSWFRWTDTTVQIPAGQEIVLPIAVDVPSGITGYKSFGVKAESTKWSSDAQDYGAVLVT
jgi:PKD repeat protein